MKKTLERLRALKIAAVERMEAINALAKKDNRELTDVEKAEYAAKKTEAENFTASIAEVEAEAAETLTAAPKPAPAAVPANAETLKREGAEAERLRASGIRKIAAPFAIDEKFVNSLIDDGATVEAAREKIMDKLAGAFEKPGIDGRNPGVTMGADARDKRREGLESALMLRAHPSNVEYQKGGREYAGLTLLDMARECLESAGVKTRGLSRHEIARVALQGHAGASEYFAGLGAMTTSDLPNILANVANKTLRMAYEAAPRTFTPFCRQVSASDFKPVNRVQLSDVSALQKTNEKGEFQRVYVSDSKETYSLATWGGIVPITRQVVLNDDMQSLTRIPAGLGVAAATLESDTVWAVITGNPNMSDSVALFHATHKNLSATNGLAAVSNITTARTQLRKQTGPKGTILNLVPKYLIVPAALEGIAVQLTNPINLAATASSSDVPAFVRTMVPIVEPRLDAVASVGATNWFTAADPSTIDTIEYCYLEGQQGVFLETRQGFDVDGLEIKARLDFAAAAIDYRGLQKNTA